MPSPKPSAERAAVITAVKAAGRTGAVLAEVSAAIGQPDKRSSQQLKRAVARGELYRIGTPKRYRYFGTLEWAQAAGPLAQERVRRSPGTRPGVVVISAVPGPARQPQEATLHPRFKRTVAPIAPDHRFTVDPTSYVGGELMAEWRRLRGTAA
jgi:hypothetical protein